MTLSNSYRTDFHHGSHTGLLHRPDIADVTPQDLDAIIVPTHRRVAYISAYIDAAIRLAGQLNVPLVALCSHDAAAVRATVRARRRQVDVVAIDVDRNVGSMLSLATENLGHRVRFHRSTDLSLKRNLGLLLARCIGWQRVLLLDDDFRGIEPQTVRAAAGLLRTHSAVGLNNIGYPDNSVVCHAYRKALNRQDTFIGGGALLINPMSSISFFPDIYNEDWFFLLGNGPANWARVGSARQRRYDPFARAVRARDEEFGDTLAEGLFWLLDEGRPVDEADLAYWTDALARRREFLVHVRDRLMIKRPWRLTRMLRSVDAARKANDEITPQACAEYVASWRTDLEAWREHVSGFSSGHDIDKALTKLGLRDRSFLWSPRPTV